MARHNPHKVLNDIRREAIIWEGWKNNVELRANLGFMDQADWDIGACARDPNRKHPYASNGYGSFGPAIYHYRKLWLKLEGEAGNNPLTSEDGQFTTTPLCAIKGAQILHQAKLVMENAADPTDAEYEVSRVLLAYVQGFTTFEETMEGLQWVSDANHKEVSS